MNWTSFLLFVLGVQSGPTLTLDEAVQNALKQSPALDAAKAEVDAARAGVGVARARTGPQVGATGFLSRSNMSMILQGPMGSDPQALVMSPKDEFANLNLMLMLPLYTGGYLSGLTAASWAALRAAEAESLGMAAEVAMMVRESYWEAFYGAARVRAEQSRVASTQAMLEVARAQVDAGKGIEASVRRAEAELAEARQDLAMAENDRKKMILDLLATAGMPMDPLPQLVETVPDLALQGGLSDWIAAAKKSRRELVAARSRVRAAEERVRSARGAQGPQVFGFAMSDTFAPKDEMGRRSGYAFGVVASMPIFDSGMRRSELDEARAMAEKARADVRTWDIRVEKEVRQAWLDVETAAQNLESARSAVVAAESSHEVVRVRVEAGKGILVEQLDALSALTRARSNVARAIASHQIAKAKLLRATGFALETKVGDPR